MKKPRMLGISATSKQVSALTLLFFLLSLSPIFAADHVRDASNEPLVVGALLPLTGSWSYLGQSAAAGLEAALKMAHFEMLPGQAGIELLIADTAGDPKEALAKLKDMHEGGIRIVVGPMKSEEALYIIDFASENDMILISPSARASQLAKEDPLIRLAPTNRHQSLALLQTMSSHGISTLALVHRDDIYGQGFRDDLVAAANSVGIAVLPAIAVDNEEPSFQEVVLDLETTITVEDSLAVLLVDSVERAHSLAHAIPMDSPLRKVKWYVGEDIAASAFALTDPSFAAFAADVAMEGFQLSLDVDIFDSSIPLIHYMILSNSPEVRSLTPYAFTAWDALRLIAFTYKQAGLVDTATFKDELINLSQRYLVVFNLPAELDENGDLKSWQYTRYRVTQASDQLAKWQLSGAYVFATGLDPFVIDYERTYTEDVGEVTIGALLPLTGQTSELGIEQLRILNLALDIARSHFATRAPGLTFSLAIRDTGGYPEQALAALVELYQQGVRSFVGPATSAEVSMVEPFAAEVGITLITPGATAPSLAKEDRIMRLILHDGFQAEAMAKYIEYHGFSEVIGLFREDIYGLELINEFIKAYAGSGAYVSYVPENLDPVDIVFQLENLLTKYPDAVVLAASFEEIVDVLEAVLEDSPLLERRWFGFDGIAQMRALTSKSSIAEKAAQVQLTAPMFNFHGPRTGGISSVLDAMTPHLTRPVSAFGSSAFDAFFFLASVWAEVGVMADEDTIWNSLTRSPYFYGTGGPMLIDENADRTVDGFFSFYTVVDKPAGPIWTKVADYEFGFFQHQLHIVE